MKETPKAVCVCATRTCGKQGQSSSISRQILAVIVTCYLCLPPTVGTSCHRRVTTQLLTYQDCVPKRLITYSCVGSCITHSQVSPANPLVIERTCYQCKETVVKKRRVRVSCPNPDGPRRFKRVTIEVPVPHECMCQSCAFEDAVNIARTATDITRDTYDINT